MITISAFKDRDEALVSKVLLEAAGIPVMLKDEVSGLELQVRDTDAELAQAVLIGSTPRSRDKRRPTVRRHSGRYRQRARVRVGYHFFRGGAFWTAGFALVLLGLLLLGIEVRSTVFDLLFVYVLGGCSTLIRHFFRIRHRFRSIRTRTL